MTPEPPPANAKEHPERYWLELNRSPEYWARSIYASSRLGSHCRHCSVPELWDLTFAFGMTFNCCQERRTREKGRKHREPRQRSELLCFPGNHSDSTEEVLPCPADLYKNPITLQNLSQRICHRLHQVYLQGLSIWRALNRLLPFLLYSEHLIIFRSATE